jgi:hypothetical protein
MKRGTLEGHENNIKIQLMTTDYGAVKWNELPHSGIICPAFVVTDINFRFHNINFLNRSKVCISTAQEKTVP